MSLCPENGKGQREIALLEFITSVLQIGKEAQKGSYLPKATPLGSGRAMISVLGHYLLRSYDTLLCLT